MLSKKSPWTTLAICGLAVAGLCGGTGCQVTTGGQILPSGYFLQDDVQYYAPGPQFKLSREAAAIKAYEADQSAQQQRSGAAR